MPTTRIEYTDNLKIEHKLKPFFEMLHPELVKMIKTDLATCRSLATAYSQYLVGDGSSHNAFLQLTIHILPGRSEALRQELGVFLLEKVKAHFHEALSSLNTQVRVYVQETDLLHYHGL